MLRLDSGIGNRGQSSSTLRLLRQSTYSVRCSSFLGLPFDKDPEDKTGETKKELQWRL